jgi:hypothetical protein
MANFCLFAANGNRKRKFVFLCQQMINSYLRLVFQQTCPSTVISSLHALKLTISKWIVS